jgi:hypothetical protein
MDQVLDNNVSGSGGEIGRSNSADVVAVRFVVVEDVGLVDPETATPTLTTDHTTTSEQTDV